MKRLIPILIVLGAFLFNAVEGHSFALPKCGGSPLTGSPLNVSLWNNCRGTHIWGPKTKQPGDKCICEWKNGTPHGQGTHFFENGDKYVGEWKYGKYNGQGTFTFGPKSKWVGDQYDGEYKNGKRHGEGTYTWGIGKNAKSHVGQFKNGLPNGLGIQTYANGRIEEGMFENGKFKYSQNKLK